MRKFTMRPSRFETILKSVDNFLERVVILVQSIFATVILPIILVQFVVLWCHRKFVFLIVRIFKSSTFAKPLVLQSALLANIDTIYTSPKFSLVGAMVLQGIPDVHHIRDVIKTQLLNKVDPETGHPLYPELLQSVEFFMGYPFWKKLNPLKINKISFPQECVRFYKDNETAQYDLSDLEAVLKELCFKPFSKDRPLIEFVILPKYTPHPEKQAHLPPTSEDKKYFVLILQIHHALADMYAIIRLLLNLGVPSSTETAEFVKPTDYTLQNKLHADGLLTRMTKHLTLAFNLLTQTVEYFHKTAMYSSEGSVWDWNEKPASPNRFGKVPRAELPQTHVKDLKLSTSKCFSLDEINEIKGIHGVSGTSVMYAALLGSIRKTMFGRNAAIPPYIAFGMTLPLPRTNHKLRNYSALLNVFLPLGEKDPIKRLHKVQERMDILKKSTLPISATFLTTCLLGMTPRPLSKFVDGQTKVLEFSTLSNIAGPKTSFNLAGYPVQDSFWTSGPAIERNCLFILLFSIQGRVKLMLTGNSELLKSDENAEYFVNNFFEELQILKHNTGYDC